MTMHVNGRMISLIGAAALLAVALMTAAGTTWHEAISSSAAGDTASLDATISCGPLTEFDPADAVTPTSAANTTHGWHIGASAIYPGYSITCSYAISNPDPVPWHLESLALTVTSAAGTSAGSCTLGGTCSWTGTYFVVAFDDDRGCQVHQAEALNGSFTVTATAAPVAIADAGPYHIHAAFAVGQWNESDYSRCGTVKP